ncbi:sugar phosphate isomerase/epimerase family protein [Tautonia plasticadhaerens]|uniref:Xylose isomerase-like TIM barrel n=1 Tax=Tautonia plasticadhaerens TaxID=2527974 RepID=A0A518HBA1_9BACT|nr:TIM barrel protein [Tautonia plasticadhaerens]QDV38097.1 Xylose isomerase-like TIM barrel [Tautonia plasticadhaerens]
MSATRRAFLASPVALPLLGGTPRPMSLGIGISSYGNRTRIEPEFRDPIRFLSHCRGLGAGGVQLPIGSRDEAYADALRAMADEAGMVFEGSTRTPDPDDPADRDRFEAELRTASRAGVTVVRTVMLGGRRYETFDSMEQFERFRDRSARSLRLAAPLLERQGVALAVENHKDFRSDEQIELLREIGSELIGVCVDLGNNLALLEDPAGTIRALAPMAMTCHVKDMAVAEAEDGFLLSEVPLGRGVLDLPGLVAAIRSARPGCRFMLEMITRDPLRIPCLADPYWETLPGVPGRDLARTLALVRGEDRGRSLPRVEGLAPEARIAEEEANVRACLDHAGKALGL